jgi:hypothetical protein
VVSPQDWKDQELVGMLERPDAPAATTDLTKIARIAKSFASDLQETVVGKAWEKPLVVYVTTGEGVPVAGATVTFRSVAESRPEFVPVGGQQPPQPAQVASVVTDQYGRATVMAFPDESITRLGILEPGTPHRQLIGLDQVTAEVQRANGDRLVLAAPFTLTARPDKPALVAVQAPAEWGAPTKMMLGTELPATVTDRFHILDFLTALPAAPSRVTTRSLRASSGTTCAAPASATPTSTSWRQRCSRRRRLWTLDGALARQAKRLNLAPEDA